MTPEAIFYILIGILIIKFLFDTIIDAVNAKHFNDKIPTELRVFIMKRNTLNLKPIKRKIINFPCL